ncbi:MAG: GAF domain-containing protein [Bacteroidetes bacterium]|nr:GAF domain-containing protein [Bacteroidota bacterium]
MIRANQIQEIQQIDKLGYWELDLNSKKLELSDELYKIFGFENANSKISFDQFLQCIYSEDRILVKQVFELSLVNYKSFSIEYRVVLPNNTIRLISWWGSVILDEKKQPIKIKGIGQDFTDQKNIELKLTAQIQIIQILSDAKNVIDIIPNILKIICESVNWQIGELWLADYSVNLLNLEGSWSSPSIDAEEFISVSMKCKFGFGVSLQGRVWESGKPLWSSNAIDDQFFPRTNFAAKLKLQTALAFPIESKKKVIGILAFYKNEVMEPDNDLLVMLDFLGKQIGDFIERKKNEPTLQESEGLYKTLVEISPDAITYTDLSGKILFCNQQAAELFGFNLVEEFIDQNIYAFTAPEDQNNAIKNENTTIELGKTKNIEYTLIKRNGTRFYAEVNTSIVRDISGKPKAFIGVIRNITNRKLAEEEIKIRIEQQATIADFGQYALAGNDLQKLMNKATEVAAKTLNIEFCELLELLPDNKTLILTAGYGWKKGSVIRTKFNFGMDSHAGFTLMSNEPVVVENYQYEKRFKASKLLKDHKVVSGITVVIKGKDKPFGILGLHSTKPRIFTKNDSHFLQAIANILSIGIGRKNIEEELAQSLKLSKIVQKQAEESKNQLEFLSEASRILNSSLDYYQTLESLSNLVIRSIADWCIIDLVEEDGVMRNVTVSSSAQENLDEIKMFHEKIRTDLYSRLRIQKVLESGKPELFHQINNSIHTLNIKDEDLLNIVRKLGLKSAVIVPLKIRDQILGAISLASVKPSFRYSTSELIFVEDLARRVSTAIETSRLFKEANLLNDKLNKKAKERSEELEISNTELEVEMKLRRNVIQDYNALVLQQSGIMELAQKSISEISPMLFLQEVVSIIPRALQVEFCGIFEINSDKKKLILRTAVGWKHTEVGIMELDIKPDFQEGYIVLHSEKLIAENYISNNKFKLQSSLISCDIKNGLSVLINKGKQHYGVLSIYTVKNKNFDQDGIRFVKIITNLISNVFGKKELEEKYTHLLNTSKSS